MLPLGRGIKRPSVTWVSEVSRPVGPRIIGFPLSSLAWQKEADVLGLSIVDV